MFRRGRHVNWTSIEREYLRLFPNLMILDDDNSSLASGGNGPNSTTNAFSLDEEQALVDQDFLDEMEETPATMVKTETPKWTNEELRRSLLEAHKQILMSAAVAASTSNQINSNSSTVNSTPTSTSEQSTSSLPATSSSTSTATTEHNFPPQKPQQQTFPTQMPIMNLRSIVAQMDATQRKQSMVKMNEFFFNHYLCLANGPGQLQTTNRFVPRTT